MTSPNEQNQRHLPKCEAVRLSERIKGKNQQEDPPI